MGGLRARDADRERYVDVIETAYVDGQLGDADRELRISRALTAETLDELDSLTRDLQNQPQPVAAATRAPARPSSPSSHAAGSAGKAMTIGVSVVVGLVFLGAVSAMEDADQAWESEVVEVPWEQLDAETSAPGFRMTNRGVRELVSAYVGQFGTLEAYEVAFHPRRVTVQVPVRGPRPRSERWTWDGEWRKDSDAAAVVGQRRRVDLGTVDAERLVDNIATARRALRVERGRFTHALLTKVGAAPVELNIYIGNEFNESGYLSTSPDGRIVRRHPYAP